MQILSQDQDLIFNYSGVSFIYIKNKYHHSDNYKRNIYMGANIIAWSFKGGKVLLGTYDDDGEARQIMREIFNLNRGGIKFYTMPAPALDLSDLF